MADDGAAAHDVRVCRDVQALHVAAAELVIDRAAAAIAGAGRFTMALSGGSTPRGLYERLASSACRDRLDWSRVHLLWGDERPVSPDHADSNYRMAREALIDHVPIPTTHVHRIHGELPPQSAADAYERTLRSLAHDRGVDDRLDVDLVLLGLGADGHTASLFPHRAVALERERWVVADEVDARGSWRVSLTPALINTAAGVAFLVVGADKAAVLAAVLEGPARPDDLPAQRIMPTSGDLVWLVDEAAAARLSTDKRA